MVGSPLYCHYKDGQSKEIKISLVSEKLSTMADFLNDIPSYICHDINGEFINSMANAIVMYLY